MGYIDREYHKLLNHIKEYGFETRDTSRNIINKQITTYNLEYKGRPNVAPILSTKYVDYNKVITELLWFLKGDTNIKYLIANNCNIWNKDAYNYYYNKCKEEYLPTLNYLEFLSAINHDRTIKYLPSDYKLGDLGPVYGSQWTNWNGINQLSEVISNIKNNNFNRRLLVNSWHVDQLVDMALPPCHWAYEILHEYTTKGDVKLSLKWHQRSVDVFHGLPYNVLSYYTLLQIICDLTQSQIGNLYGDLSNIHIYGSHQASVDKQLERNPYEHISPNTIVHVDYTSLLEQYLDEEISLEEFFNKLKPYMFSLENYTHDDTISVPMVARVIK